MSIRFDLLATWLSVARADLLAGAVALVGAEPIVEAAVWVIPGLTVATFSGSVAGAVCVAAVTGGGAIQRSVRLLVSLITAIVLSPVIIGAIGAPEGSGAAMACSWLTAVLAFALVIALSKIDGAKVLSALAVLLLPARIVESLGIGKDKQP